LLFERFKFIRGNNKGVIVGRCTVMPNFWAVLVERNRMVFDDVKGEDVDYLCERVWFWASLWASVCSEFMVSGILSYWRAAMYV
jgi:hypothetical protein